MAGLVPAVHVFLVQDVDVRHKAGHDEGESRLTDRQRIDKWLWHARVVRTRSAAAALVTSGHVRLNGARCLATSSPVRGGDVVTVALDRTVRILKVRGFSERRGDAEAARPLFEDLTPPPAPPGEAPAAVAPREPGSGRPTKQERRAIDRLMDGEDR